MLTTKNTVLDDDLKAAGAVVEADGLSGIEANALLQKLEAAGGGRLYRAFTLGPAVKHNLPERVTYDAAYNSVVLSFPAGTVKESAEDALEVWLRYSGEVRKASFSYSSGLWLVELSGYRAPWCYGQAPELSDAIRYALASYERRGQLQPRIVQDSERINPASL